MKNRKITVKLLSMVMLIFLIGCETKTVTDIDGNVYKTVKIGNQVWMAENLKVTHYRNGGEIPHLTSDNDWTSTSSGAYCAYDNNESNADTYGYLYNWYAVDDSRNITPEGWHIPTDDEWTELETHLGLSQTDTDLAGMRGTEGGGKLKEEGTTHWNNPNRGATNESGFTALPGGYRGTDGKYNKEGGIGIVGLFWSHTENNKGKPFIRLLHHNQYPVGYIISEKEWGLSIRCVKD